MNQHGLRRVIILLAVVFAVTISLGQFHQFKDGFTREITARLNSVERVLAQSGFENLATLQASTDFLNQPGIAWFSVVDLASGKIVRESHRDKMGVPDSEFTLAETGRPRYLVRFGYDYPHLAFLLAKSTGFFIFSLVIVAALLIRVTSLYSREALKKRVALGELASRVAHDVNSPLSALSMVLAKAQFENGDAKEIATGAIERVNKIMAGLLHDHRDIEKPQISPGSESQGALLVRFTSMDCVNALRRLVMEKTAERGREGVTMTFTSPTEARGSIAGELNDLIRIVSNLINNSVQSFRPSGHVRVAMEMLADAQAPEMIVRIFDNGSGIPPMVLERLAANQSSSTKLRGNGIGLLSAKQTCEKSGWKFNISSREGSGTAITISLPLAEDVMTIPSPVRSPAARGGGCVARG